MDRRGEEERESGGSAASRVSKRERDSRACAFFFRLSLCPPLPPPPPPTRNRLTTKLEVVRISTYPTTIAYLSLYLAQVVHRWFSSSTLAMKARLSRKCARLVVVPPAKLLRCLASQRDTFAFTPTRVSRVANALPCAVVTTSCPAPSPSFLFLPLSPFSERV